MIKKDNRYTKFQTALLVMLFVTSVILIKPLHILLDHNCDSVSYSQTSPQHSCEICSFHFDSFIYTPQIEDEVLLNELCTILVSNFAPDLVFSSQSAHTLRAPPALL